MGLGFWGFGSFAFGFRGLGFRSFGVSFLWRLGFCKGVAVVVVLFVLCAFARVSVGGCFSALSECGVSEIKIWGVSIGLLKEEYTG